MIYYFLDPDTPLTAIFIYGKGEQVNLTAKQKRAVTDMAAAIKKASRTSKGTA